VRVATSYLKLVELDFLNSEFEIEHRLEKAVAEEDSAAVENGAAEEDSAAVENGAAEEDSAAEEDGAAEESK